jgi:hypothetical protein
MLELVVVHGDDPETGPAVPWLLAEARRRVGARAVRAGVLLAGIDHDHAAALRAVVAAFPGIALIGCTTDGELSSAGGFTEDALLLMLLVGDGFEAAAGLGRGADVDAVAAVDAAVDAAVAGLRGPPRLCLTLPESMTCDAVVVGAELQRRLGDVPVIGGLAGDAWRFQRPKQFCGAEVVDHGVPVLLLAGDFKLGHGVASGWTPIGGEGEVEEAHGNVVVRIGGDRALDFYQRLLGPHIHPSGEYPLAVQTGDGAFYLRAPVAHDAGRGTITFVGAIPHGARVQIASATRDDIVDATRRSVEAAIAAYPGARPSGALVVSCAARKQVLGTRVAEEQAILAASALGSAPFAGFYAYGELSPVRAGGAVLFHNETFVTLVFGAE